MGWRVVRLVRAPAIFFHLAAFIVLLASTSRHVDANLEKMSSWAGFQASPSRDGVGYGPWIESRVLEWEFRTDNTIESTPALGCTTYLGNTEVVFVPSGGTLYCVGTTVGHSEPEAHEHWRFNADGDLRSPSVSGDCKRLYIGTSEGKLWCLDSTNGEVIWEWASESGTGDVEFAIEHPDGRSLIFSDTYRVYAVEPPSGKLLWETDLGENVRSYTAPSLSPSGEVVYMGLTSNEVVSYEVYNGNLLWRVGWAEFENGVLATIPVVSESTSPVHGLLIVASEDGFVRGVMDNGGTATVEWETDLESVITASPALSPRNDFAYVCDHDGMVYSVSVETGDIEWSYDTGFKIFSSPAVTADGYIYVAAWDTDLYAFASNGSVMWTWPLDGVTVSGLAIGIKGVVYTGSWAKKLIAIEATHSCPRDCSGHGDCDTRSGHCMCHDGYSSYACQDCAEDFIQTQPGECTAKKHCPESCSGHGSCQVLTGKCECLEGYAGRGCYRCDEDNDFRGYPSCSLPNECPANCSGRGVCVDLVCVCAWPYGGVACEACDERASDCDSLTTEVEPEVDESSVDSSALDDSSSDSPVEDDSSGGWESSDHHEVEVGDEDAEPALPEKEIIIVEKAVYDPTTVTGKVMFILGALFITLTASVGIWYGWSKYKRKENLAQLKGEPPVWKRSLSSASFTLKSTLGLPAQDSLKAQPKTVRREPKPLPPDVEDEWKDYMAGSGQVRDAYAEFK